MFNYNQETIYSLLCAVLPCFIYLLVWGRKKPLLHSVWEMCIRDSRLMTTRPGEGVFGSGNAS